MRRKSQTRAMLEVALQGLLQLACSISPQVTAGISSLWKLLCVSAMILKVEVMEENAKFKELHRMQQELIACFSESLPGLRAECFGGIFLANLGESVHIGMLRPTSKHSSLHRKRTSRT